MSALALASLPLADGWDMHGDGAGWMVVPMIGMALFWGAVIFGVIWLIRDVSERRPRQPDDSALEVLDRRFAEGALSVAQFQQRRGVLAGSSNEGGSP